jgi:hypothetical protein
MYKHPIALDVDTFTVSEKCDLSVLKVHSTPDTASLHIPVPLHCTQESLGTDIPYVVSKGISPVKCHAC